MGYPLTSQVIIDKRLTNISLAYTNEDNYIQDRILPTVQVNEVSGLIGGFANDHLRTFGTSKRSAYDTSPHFIEYKLAEDKRYNIDFYDKSIEITDIMRKNYGFEENQIFNADRSALMTLEETRMLEMETALADILGDNTKLTENDTPTTLWDVTNSTPLNDLEAAAENIRSLTGRRPNKMVINQKVVSALKTNEQILTRVNGVQKLLSQQDVIDIIKNFLGIEEILIGKTIKINSLDGQPVTKADVWGKDCVLYYTPNTPSLFTPSFGYRFVHSGTNKIVKKFRSPYENSDIITMGWGYQDNILDVNSAYLLEDVIS